MTGNSYSVVTLTFPHENENFRMIWLKEGVQLNSISLNKRQNNIKCCKDQLDFKPINANEAAELMNTALSVTCLTIDKMGNIYLL